MKQGKKT